MTIYRRSWQNRNGTIKKAWLAETTIQGVRRRKQFRTYAEAVAGEAALKHPLNSQPRQTIRTFEELSDQYIAELTATGRERSTIEAYAGQLRRHILPILHNVPLAAIDRPSVVLVMARISEKLSRRYAHKTVSTFRRLVTFAYDMGVIPTNAAAGLRFSASRERRMGSPQERLRVPTKEEIGLLLRLIEWGDGNRRSQIDRSDIVATLGLYGGLRPSETRGLRVRDVAEIDGAAYLRISQRADAFNEIGPVKTTNAIRDVPIPRRVLEQIRTFIQQQSVDPAGLLLTTADGESPIDYSNFVARDWKKFLGSDVGEQPGTLTITLHALRHAYASLQIARGIDPKTLQHRMGHSSVQTTLDIYGHLWPDRFKDAEDAEAFDAALQVLRDQ